MHIGMPGDALQYTDAASVLTPHTTYEYRIRVRNSVGQSYGPWAEVTTRSSSESVYTNIFCYPLCVIFDILDFFI